MFITKNKVLLAVSILLAIAFLGAGLWKLSGAEMMVGNFERFGYPLWFMYFVGLAEVAGAIGLFVQRTAFYAAACLGILMLGAVGTRFLLNDSFGLIVPAIVLGTAGTAGMVRTLRNNLLDELYKPYVVTARAKGVVSWRLIIKYPVRVAVNPMISGFGGIFAGLLSSSVIVSVVLSLPTLGPLMLAALLQQDMYLALRRGGRIPHAGSKEAAPAPAHPPSVPVGQAPPKVAGTRPRHWHSAARLESIICTR